MNNFVKLLENDIIIEKKSKERLESTVVFEIEIPLDNYEHKGSLYKKYAARDLLTPVEEAKKKIKNVMKIRSLPLNIEIEAFYKKQTMKNTIFTVHVDGANEHFLIKLLDSLND